MIVAERASEAISAEQANDWAARASERVAQYSTRRFHIISTLSASVTLRDNIL